MRGPVLLEDSGGEPELGDDSMIKSSCGSCTGPGFESQNPYVDLQSSVTQDPGDPVSSSGLHEHKHIRDHMPTCREKSPTQNKNK